MYRKCFSFKSGLPTVAQVCTVRVQAQVTIMQAKVYPLLVLYEYHIETRTLHIIQYYWIQQCLGTYCDVASILYCITSAKMLFITSCVTRPRSKTWLRKKFSLFNVVYSYTLRNSMFKSVQIAGFANRNTHPVLQ